jgi:DNA (cytosine-5)-methyltransferase 1
MQSKPIHVSLFSGIGGIDLAADWAGFETKAMCEIDPFCRRVLRKHWPDMPIWEDVKSVTVGHFQEAGIERIDLLSFGSPCQDLSDAGKGAGLDGERSGLFFEAIRLVAELDTAGLKPRWLLFENVRGLLSRGIDRAISSMEAQGYEVWPLLLGASDIGARHRRNRTIAVAYSAGEYGNARHMLETCQEWQAQGESGGLHRLAVDQGWEPRNAWFECEPRLARLVSRVPDRVDRLESLGNSVMPAQVYPILYAIRQMLEVLDAV